MSNQKEKLFTDFPPVSTDDWMEVVTKDLKGADFQKRLVWRTNEGFNVQPFYRAADIEGFKTTDNLPGEFPYVRGTRKENKWYVRQEMHVTDCAKTNRRAVELLEKGVTSFGFHLTQKTSVEDLETLLKGISPEEIELNFRTTIPLSIDLARNVIAYLKKQNVAPEKCYGSIDLDPFRPIFEDGYDNEDWIEQAVELINITKDFPNFRAVSVTGYIMDKAGAYIYQELGFSLAYGNEVLSKLVEKGVDAPLAAGKIKFEMGIGSNYFMEIAKFRAARWLWAQIVYAYKDESESERENDFLEAAKMNVHATTSLFNKSLYDPNVNMLRTQTEAMSAIIGSVNSLTVNPYDLTFETPSQFAERIALNQQLLLKEESHFDKITDPSAGSYYIETLTNAIAEQAWNLFLQMEEKGFYTALKEGVVQDMINQSAAERFTAAAKRKEVLLGTNQYPNFSEAMDSRIEDKNKEKETASEKETPLKRLNRKPLAQDFNELRLATERSGKRPKVFMLTIGNLAFRLARSQFSSNFFGCAGYEIIDNLGFKTVQEGVEAAIKKNADIIVLCSSDDEYATLAPQAYDLIKERKELFVVAGAPACMEDLKEHGIEHFIHVRSNVLETLQMFNSKLL